MSEMRDPAKVKPRKLGCFELAVHWREAVNRPSPEVDWVKAVPAASEQDRHVSAPHGVEYVFAPRGQRSVIVAKRIPDLDVQTVDHESLEISPIKLENVEDFFARANYVSFYSFNAFTMFSPQPGSPTLKAVAAIANQVHPVEGGVWEARPIMARGDIEQFNESRQMRGLTFHGTVRPTSLFTADDAISAGWSRISDTVGADLSIRIEVKVKKPTKHQEAMKKLRSVFRPDDMVGADKLTVDVTDGFVATTLNLLEHELATSVELPVTGAVVIEADLIQNLEVTSATMEKTVKETLQLKEG